MAVQKRTTTPTADKPAATKAAKTAPRDEAAQRQSSEVERKMVALAERMGGLLGTARARADGWLESERLRKELTRIRDGATALLEQVSGASAEAPEPVTPRPGRGAVDAPGKRHRKPPPQETVTKRMAEPAAKQLGRKPVVQRRHGGRG
jgi:hypothetical protein